ncbi:MAG: energy transducer TonB [Rhodanobacter sp.]
MPRLSFAVSHRYALALVSVLILAAAVGIFWYSRAMANASLDATGLPSTTAAAAPTDDGTGILLGLARDAMHDGRLVTPAGSNAYEFYLSVLQLEPKNPVAQDALRETFPRAAVEIESTINKYDLEEARREIDLLREFDSNNFTLALLGGKLSAARSLVTRRHEVEAERIQQATAAQSR